LPEKELLRVDPINGRQQIGEDVADRLRQSYQLGLVLNDVDARDELPEAIPNLLTIEVGIVDQHTIELLE